MAASLPYLASNKNLPVLFEKISAAKLPEKFTHSFLTSTIGLKGTNDRALIPLLRTMGFIDQSGTPLPAYRLLKGHKAGAAIFEGMKRAYEGLFDSDQDAHKLPLDRLKSLIAQVAGSDVDLTARIAGTFSALSKLADFDTKISEPDTNGKVDSEITKQDESSSAAGHKSKSLRTEFHYNIQVHLPANGSEETYLHIFNAIRKTFQ